MTQDQPSGERGQRHPTGAGRRLVQLIVIGGLALPVVVGLAARAHLQSQGVPVVSVGQGAVLLVPVIILHEVPFAILALIVRRMLSDVPQSDDERYLPRVFASVGAFLGLAGVLGFQLFDTMSYPGGFGEVVGMMIALWIITIPLLLVFGAMGIVAGGAAGILVWLVVSRFLRL